MSVQFYVGEQPSDPLVVTVRNSDGTIRNLTGVDSVEFVGDELPAGTASISDALAGKVQYDFDAPFAVAANLRLQIEMVNGTDTDRSAPFTLVVSDPAEATLPIVSPAQVEQWTNVSVSNGDVIRAQGIVSLVVGRNLADVDWYAARTDSDRFWLQMGVAWQAAEHPEGTTINVALPYVPGASSISNGDVSISYTEGGGDELASLAANARLALKRLSWLRPIRSVSALPFLSERGCPPPLWRVMSRGNRV